MRAAVYFGSIGGLRNPIPRVRVWNAIGAVRPHRIQHRSVGASMKALGVFLAGGLDLGLHNDQVDPPLTHALQRIER